MRAHFQNQFVVGIRFRAAITGFVYRKVIYLSYVCHYLSMVFFPQSLKLSNSSKQETTTGEIVNLVRIISSSFHISFYSYSTDGH